MPVGSHEIEIRTEVQTSTKSLLVEKGQTTEVTFAPKDFTAIEVAARPPDRVYIVGKDGAKMSLIPAGDFRMGSADGSNDEDPPHTVYLDEFYIDVYEVTNAQFKEFIKAEPQWGKDRIPRKYHDGHYLKHWNENAYPSGKGNHPVVNVSWYATSAYAQWAGKRLPTEAEWEKAARGHLKGKAYPWGDSIDESQANYNANVGDTTPVGRYDPNGYGLFDMAGNVWEWCLDEYDSGFYAESLPNNPVVGGEIQFISNHFTDMKTHRVWRGGSWFNDGNIVRVANRYEAHPSDTCFDIGFRCVKSVTP